MPNEAAGPTSSERTAAFAAWLAQMVARDWRGECWHCGTQFNGEAPGGAVHLRRAVWLPARTGTAAGCQRDAGAAARGGGIDDRGHHTVLGYVRPYRPCGRAGACKLPP